MEQDLEEEAPERMQKHDWEERLIMEMLLCKMLLDPTICT